MKEIKKEDIVPYRCYRLLYTNFYVDIVSLSIVYEDGDESCIDIMVIEDTDPNLQRRWKFGNITQWELVDLCDKVSKIEDNAEAIRLAKFLMI